MTGIYDGFYRFEFCFPELSGFSALPPSVDFPHDLPYIGVHYELVAVLSMLNRLTEEMLHKRHIIFHRPRLALPPIVAEKSFSMPFAGSADMRLSLPQGSYRMGDSLLAEVSMKHTSRLPLSHVSLSLEGRLEQLGRPPRTLCSVKATYYPTAVVFSAELLLHQKHIFLPTVTETQAWSFQYTLKVRARFTLLPKVYEISTPVHIDAPD